jgi:hypothetical protein
VDRERIPGHPLFRENISDHPSSLSISQVRKPFLKKNGLYVTIEICVTALVQKNFRFLLQRRKKVPILLSRAKYLYIFLLLKKWEYDVDVGIHFFGQDQN